MAYQITLTDDEYAALSAAASQQGEPIAELVHKAIASQYTMSSAIRPQQGTYSIPTGKPISPSLKAEMEQLAERIGNEKPWLSDMVIEDRGPR
ncbi:MAG TPA: hypothetical protein VMV29_21710 [Ktedonobacterales bacterium]|nr:hypothetical protein [Ktedonobacterales bacterium]